MSWRRYALNRRSLLSLLLAGGALVGCNQVASVVARPAGPASGTTPLEDIQNVGDLQALFAKDRGKLRLVLLVSPT
jgi:hypothetical protein